MNPLIAIFISFYTLIIFLAFRSLLKSSLQKTFYFSGLWGTWLLCGIGASYQGVPIEYLFYYLIFILVLSLSFLFSIRRLNVITNKLMFISQSGALDSFRKPQNVYFIVAAYFFLSLLSLLYPDFKLHRLIDPPRLDISFFTGLSPNEDAIQKIIKYFEFMLFPFFLVSLFHFRKRLCLLFFIIAFPIYVKFCATGYVGRGYLLIWFLIIVAASWIYYPQKRRITLTLALAAVPALLILFYAMGHIRAGNENLFKNADLSESLGSLLYFETNFPYYSKYVIFSDQRADLVDYYKWLVTTPIPKLISGDIKGARINYEIAYLTRGLSPGDSGFTVDLTGLITESIYIYGNNIFWVHAIFVGVLFAFLCALMEGLPRTFLFTAMYIVVYWGYIINRAGIASAWPQLVNGFLSLYAFIIFKILTSDHQRINRVFYANSNVFPRKNPTPATSRYSRNKSIKLGM